MEIYNSNCILHGNLFTDEETQRNERNTFWVICLTAVMMVIEISAGLIFNSMALLADGWHMASHAGALGITALAYVFARKHAGNSHFTFGTGKVSSLAGFASAVSLMIVAVIMGWESFVRLFQPQQISFDKAMLVAVAGLVVNLVSAYLLGHHGHGHDHSHHSGHSHNHDHNIRAAYLHVLADALTSVLAIFALFCGKYFGLVWMDPVMGLVGGLVVGKWALGLLKDTGKVLLDHSEEQEKRGAIHKSIESDGECRITDLHLWQAGTRHHCAIISLSADNPRLPDYYKGLLKEIDGLVHVTVEINPVIQ